jgi:hypothetical protein
MRASSAERVSSAMWWKQQFATIRSKGTEARSSSALEMKRAPR